MRPINTRRLLVFVVALILVVVTVLLQAGQAGAIQGVPPTTPEPTLQALGSQIATQQAVIDSMKLEFQALKNETEDQIRDFRWINDSKMFWWSTLFLAAGALLGFFGLRTYSGIDEKIQSRVAGLIERELFRVDPTMKRIYVPASQEKLVGVLERSGLKNIVVYEDLGKQTTSGITIYHVASADDEKLLRAFLKEYAEELDPTRAAIIVYATGGHRVNEGELTEIYANLTIANLPVTVVSAILAVSRGLVK